MEELRTRRTKKFVKLNKFSQHGGGDTQVFARVVGVGEEAEGGDGIQKNKLRSRKSE